ncbi:MAG: putative blue pigment (indigoidine) exporter [Bermanella sp.]|jgi:probable blue pigment (indigoidine) exporter
MKSVLWTVLTAIAPILWGSTYIVTTEFLPQGTPFTTAVIRCLPAGIILIVMSRYLPARTEWTSLLQLSFFNFACFQGLLFMAAYRLPGGLAAVIGAVQPFIVLGLSWLVLKHKPSALTLFACMGAIFGMALLILVPLKNQGVQWDEIGMLAAFLGAVSMGFGTFYSKHWQALQSSQTPILAFTGWQLALGGIMLLPFSLVLDPDLPPLTLNHVVGFSYLALGGTLIAYLIWFTGVRLLNSASVSALGILSPISAIVLGWIVLRQAIEGWALVGLIIVISSIFLVQFSQARSRFLNVKPTIVQTQEKTV